MLKKFLAISIFISCFSFQKIAAQNVSFELKTSPNITFDFNTIQEYLSGIVYMNAVTLNINTDREFDLYVGSTTTVPNMWDVTNTYSTGGIAPPVSLLKLQFRNASSTSLMSGFFSLTDITTPVYIIGTNASDLAVACPTVGTNGAGSYLVNPNCYKFMVDLKIVPGFTYQSGLYTLRVDFVIIEDL
jgi:hypothetical protein